MALKLRMLPKKNRLKRKKDFEKVFKEGKGFRETFLFLKVLENDQKETRIGFVAPKKYFKKATLRNKIKRRLREQIRRRLLKMKKGNDIIILAKKGLEELDFRQTNKQIEDLLAKAKLYSDDSDKNSGHLNSFND